MRAEGIPSDGGYTPLNKEPFLKYTMDSRKAKLATDLKELAQDKLIANLQVLYHCEDRKCSFNYCWPNGTGTKHIHLTHLRTWSAALEAKETGVDMESPTCQGDTGVLAY